MSLIIPALVSGTISIFGVLLSVILTRYLTNRANIQQSKVQTTLDMFKHFQMITENRIKAAKILRRQLRANHEISYMDLNETLAPEEWQHISITRHFFTELSRLYSAEKLDSNLAKILFSDYFRYWHNEFFHLLNTFDYGDRGGTGIHISSDDIAAWLLEDKLQNTSTKSRRRIKTND
ncbi:MAG: hypothetical protein AAF609_11200 [Cyanobacteria bacterium P01_C01_bin.120]